MWFFDTATLAFLEVNDAAVAHYGYSRDEFLAMTIADIRPPEDVDRMRATVGRAGPGEIDEAGVWRHRKKDGSIILVEITSHAVERRGRPAEFVLAHDVTKRVTSEANLARLNSDLQRALAWQRTIFEASRDAIFLSDEDGRFVSVNRAAVALTGYSREELLAMSIPDLHEDADLAAFREFHDRIVEGEEILSHAPILRKDGRKVPVEFNNTRLVAGDRRLVHTVARDVTERERAGETLAASEKRYRRLHESMSDAFVSVDMSGRIRETNPALRELLGYSEEELGRLTYVDLTPMRWHELEARIVAEQILPRGYSDVYEKEYRRKDGTVLPVELRTFLLRDDEGQPVSMWAIVRDISQRHLLEEKLRQAQKMEAVGQLAGGVAHDFNNALMVISGNAELALAGMPADDPKRGPMTDIRKSAERAANLTRQLLAFGRRQMLAPRLVDVHDVVAGLERMLHRLLGESVTVATDLTADPSWVMVDPSQLEQVIVHLVLNARDAMPRGGRVTIRTRSIAPDDPVANDFDETTGRRGFPKLAISVSDTGKGIDPRVRARLFEPFFTTKEFGKGSGLGLATSFGFVKQSGGHMTVESEPGRGATFTIFLPAERGAPARGASSATRRALPRGTETILVAEDDDGVRRVVRTTLEATGYRVIEARNGEEAIAAAKAFAGRIDLVLSDVVMPGMGGPELAAHLKGKDPDLRVLLMTGYTDEGLLLRGLEPDAAPLQKPFTPLVLALRLREALDSPRAA
jgi:PAS domain S-box-containing protein